jgi:ATP-dependent RNA helicase DHX36
VAERVASERAEDIGETVGYQIRLEKMAEDAQTKLLFCTTGILLRKLQLNPTLKGVSHVILDEGRFEMGCTCVCVCGDGAPPNQTIAPPLTTPSLSLFVHTVHERSLDSDFLLIILRDLLPRRPDLKASEIGVGGGVGDG